MVLLVSFSVILVLLFQPLSRYARATAAQLLDPSHYTDVVLGQRSEAR